MGLLDFLRPQGAQAPGSMSQPSGFSRLLQPEVALPMAAALMGNQGNMANIGNAFGAAAPALQQQKELQAQTAKQNKTAEWLRTQDPKYAQMLDGGLEPKDVYGMYLEDRKVQAPKQPASVQEYEYARQNGFDGSYTDWQTKSVREQDPTFGREMDLRKEYDADPNVKNYKIVRDNYERIRQGSTLTTGAGDIAMVFGYMKMLDPTSVVRESEQATAENAVGVPAQIRNLWNKVYSGEKLPPEARQQIAEAANQIYQQSAANVGDTNSRYGSIADRYQLGADNIVQKPEQYDPIDPLGIR